MRKHDKEHYSERATFKQRKHSERVARVGLIARKAVRLAEIQFGEDLSQSEAQKLAWRLLKRFETGQGHYASSEIIKELEKFF